MWTTIPITSRARAHPSENYVLSHIACDMRRRARLPKATIAFRARAHPAERYVRIRTYTHIVREPIHRMSSLSKRGILFGMQ